MRGPGTGPPAPPAVPGGTRARDLRTRAPAAVTPEPLLDEDAGRLVRPFTVCGGRTRPAARLDLLTLVTATGRRIRRRLGPEHAQVLGACRGPASVAEIAAYVGLPAAVTKVLLSDLLDSGAVTVSPPLPPGRCPTDPDLLRAVLHGLRQLV
ncbi:DUF742 domain-containing protein [Streptomyces avicenniae]|uniref:DUF742 domain-containing protein n=1 Tax=Streptomyces avicenniae TaxID=500153 RepID=UPI000A629C82|nr:DUF742 domain-containing protein [Streptomyces avicenniae]